MKNPQYLGELAVAEFLTKNNVLFTIEDGYRHRRQISIQLENESDYIDFIEIFADGVISIEDCNSENSEKFKLLADKFIKENSCEITQEIDKEYETIQKIMDKKRAKMDSWTGMLHNGYVTIYSKKIKRLIVYPDISIRRPASVYTLYGDVKRLHEAGYLSNVLHEEAYYIMNNILEKPLNQYTDDELTLMEMLDI